MSDDQTLLEVRGVSHRYGDRYGCRDVDLDLWPGEVLAVVGESGSGKTTLLGALSQRLSLTEGSVRYRLADGTPVDLSEISESAVRRLWRTEWGFVHQNPADGLRMHVPRRRPSAGFWCTKPHSVRQSRRTALSLISDKSTGVPSARR